MPDRTIEWPKRSLGRHVFLPVERAILDATHAALPAPSADLFRRQIEQMRSAERLLSWTEVDFHPAPAAPGHPKWHDEDLFPNRHHDLKIAKVSFHADGQRYTAFVHVVVGHFFAITSRPGLKSARRVDPDISSVALLADPMDPAAAPPRKLPRSYTSFVSKNGTGTHHGWDVLSVSELYEVTLEDGEYLVLATLHGESYLLTRSEGGGLFYADHDDKPRRIKGTFDEALRS